MIRASDTVALAVALGVGLGVSGRTRQAEPDLVGVWNLKTGDQSEGLSGRVPTSLLRVELVDGALEGQLTSIRDRFVPVDDFRVKGAAISFAFGAYEYTLELDGDLMTGTVVSPFGTEPVTGRRQVDLTYGSPEEFRTARQGTIGHRLELAPPDDEPDPAAWVLSRVQAPMDLAIIFNRSWGGQNSAVTFVNAEDFEEELRALAGQPVEITAVWEGEVLRLESIESIDPDKPALPVCPRTDPNC